MEKYGALKVACEQVAAELAGDRLLTIRPGYVVGPYDYTERFTHWVRAVADGEPIIGPDADQPLQCIDGRDLAAFTVDCVERGVDRHLQRDRAAGRTDVCRRASRDRPWLAGRAARGHLDAASDDLPLSASRRSGGR